MAQIFVEHSAWKPGRSVQRKAGGAPNLISTSSRPWSKAAVPRKYPHHLRKPGVNDQSQVAIRSPVAQAFQARGLHSKVDHTSHVSAPTAPATIEILAGIGKPHT